VSNQAGRTLVEDVDMLPKPRRGLATVEMVLVLPILLLLILGGIDLGLQISTMHEMTNAAREAARTLAVRQGTVAQAQGEALNLLKDPQGKLYTVTAAEPTDANSYDVKVHISVPRSKISLMAGLGSFLTSGNLNAEVVMRKEGM
jgi:hypothetical protein